MKKFLILLLAGISLQAQTPITERIQILVRRGDGLYVAARLRPGYVLNLVSPRGQAAYYELTLPLAWYVAYASVANTEFFSGSGSVLLRKLPSPGSVDVYVNGLRLEVVRDYTETGQSIVFQKIWGPADRIVVRYVTQR